MAKAALTPLAMGGNKITGLGTATAAQDATTLAKAQAVLSVTAIIKTGAAVVANNVMPPGLRINYPTTATILYIRAGTLPSGSSLTVRINKNGVSWNTISLPSGNTSNSASISSALVSGDILTFDITAVGSTTAGSDIAIDLVGE